MARLLLLTCLLSIPVIGISGQIYLNEADFLSDYPVYQFEGFESYPTTPCVDGNNTFAGSLFSVTSTATAGGNSFLCIDLEPATSPPFEGTRGLEAGSYTEDSFILTFNLISPVSAVSFWLTDTAETGDTYFRLSGIDDILMSSCCKPTGNNVFFGYAAGFQFTQFQLVNEAINDGWGIDSVRLASAVPEPPAIILLSLGLTGLAWSRRRRRNP